MIADNAVAVRARVQRAAERAGRDPSTIRIVAAAKDRTAEAIKEVVAAGVTDVGENRAQELRDHHRALGDGATWHFLGGIQTNKVRYLDPVSLVHSLDRAEEAEALAGRGRQWDALVEVNVAGEATKQGVRPEGVGPFVRSLPEQIRVRGLMVVAPLVGDPEDVRWVFAEARRLRDRLSDVTDGFYELSMGMTDDFEVAIEEGATIVRIGRAIFRPT